MFSDFFRGYRNGTLAWKGLGKISLAIGFPDCSKELFFKLKRYYLLNQVSCQVVQDIENLHAINVV